MARWRPARTTSRYRSRGGRPFRPGENRSSITWRAAADEHESRVRFLMQNERRRVNQVSLALDRGEPSRRPDDGLLVADAERVPYLERRPARLHALEVDPVRDADDGALWITRTLETLG